ncbi:(2Fe-2S)-binding protein [Suttonella sp. R2A3]|uniref:(2Fe-2S)-binding protein n=1 Tax=Suttonella sp. R2A3 TaxID=2908648 RepID=UPI001F3D0C68|nr:(2Fe-2S)-binding protein [Suttonella sp. R2A3]UJF25411.1 (2Fe-2S)-binding protein [Suttonella sp. R2A3]
MYICICHKINDKTITKSIADGANNRVALMNQLGAGTACGKCVSILDEMIDAHTIASITSEDMPILFIPSSI